jgi:hypothetical protein
VPSCSSEGETTKRSQRVFPSAETTGALVYMRLFIIPAIWETEIRRIKSKVHPGKRLIKPYLKQHFCGPSCAVWGLSSAEGINTRIEVQDWPQGKKHETLSKN